MAWAEKHNLKHILIEPSSPTQNAYITRFNGTLRNEYQAPQQVRAYATSNIRSEASST